MRFLFRSFFRPHTDASFLRIRSMTPGSRNRRSQAIARCKSSSAMPSKCRSHCGFRSSVIIASQVCKNRRSQSRSGCASDLRSFPCRARQKKRLIIFYSIVLMTAFAIAHDRLHNRPGCIQSLRSGVDGGSSCILPLLNGSRKTIRIVPNCRRGLSA